MQSKSIMYLATYKVNQQINDHHQKTEKTKNSQLETSRQNKNGWNLPKAEIDITIGDEMIVNHKPREQNIIYYAVYGIQIQKIVQYKT